MRYYRTRRETPLGKEKKWHIKGITLTRTLPIHLQRKRESRNWSQGKDDEADARWAKTLMLVHKSALSGTSGGFGSRAPHPPEGEGEGKERVLDLPRGSSPLHHEKSSDGEKFTLPGSDTKKKKKRSRVGSFLNLPGIRDKHNRNSNTRHHGN